jgi:3-oxoacid CoA-transferase subunit B
MHVELLSQGGFSLLERAPGVSVDDIIKATAGKLVIDGDVPEMVI